MCILSGNRIAVIGAGAAGLVCAKVLIGNDFDVTVFEKSSNVGGVWNFAESTAMYDSLRTNLPKEIMAFSIDDPFPSENGFELNSFLSHNEIQKYLEDYATKHDLHQHIRFSHQVQHVYKVREGTHSYWTVEHCDSSNNKTSQQFDAVIICNGHFNVPYTPNDTPGYAHFRGVSHHSSEYDRIKPTLSGKNVLVVGSMSSGTDMARELVPLAHNVYISDRSSTTVDYHQLYNDIPHNLHILPGIQSVQEDGSVLFANNQHYAIDVILWCTGYLYDFPFLNTSQNNTDTITTMHSTLCSTSTSTSTCVSHPHTVIANPLANPVPITIEDGRRVRGLYQQLLCIDDPSLVLMGLPFRVVPFPLFYYQAEYVAAVFTGRASLPSVSDQYAWLAAFEADLKQNGGYETKYHFLGGPPQWEYCRFLAQKSGLLGGSGSSGSDNSSGSIDSGSSVCATVVLVAPDTTMTGPNSITPTTAALRTTHYSTLQHTQYLTMLETLYDDNMEHRVLYPGAQDSYRNRVYTVDRDNFSWTVQEAT